MGQKGAIRSAVGEDFVFDVLSGDLIPEAPGNGSRWTYGDPAAFVPEDAARHEAQLPDAGELRLHRIRGSLHVKPKL